MCSHTSVWVSKYVTCRVSVCAGDPTAKTDKFKYTEGDELKSFDSHTMSCMFFIDELTKNNYM